MAWVNTRWAGSISPPPYFDPEVGAPMPSLVPRWPRPGDERVDGRRRWITEPLRLPYANRALFIAEYSATDPALQGGFYDFQEVAWSTYSFIEQGFLIADTQVSNFGTRARHAIYCGSAVEDSASAMLDQYLLLQTPTDPERRAVLPSSTNVAFNQIGGTALWTPPPQQGCVVRSQEILTVNTSVNGAILSNQDGDRPDVFDRYFPTVGGAAPFLTYCRFIANDDRFFFVSGFAPRSVQHDIVLESLSPNQSRWVVIVRWVYDTNVPGSSVEARFHGPTFDPTDVGGPNTIPFTAQFDSLEDFGAGVSDIDFTAATVDVTTPAVPGLDQYPWKRLTCFPFSECYPVETFLQSENGESGMNELVGIFAQFVPSQSINVATPLQLLAPIREVGGQWWFPAPGDPTQIVVPAPWNHVDVRAKINTGQSRTNSVQLSIKINGAVPDDADCTQNDRASGTAQAVAIQAVTPHWYPVTPGDIITVEAVQSGGIIGNTAKFNWVSVRGAYLI